MSGDIQGGGGGGESSTPAAATPAAPTTTADIAAKVIDQYDSAEAAGAEPAGDSAAPAEPTDAAQLSEEEQILREFKYATEFKPDGREHWIPRSKVSKMLANALKKSSEKWSGEKAPLEQELGTLRDFRDRFAQALRGDERAFLQEIAQHDPRYARFLQDKVEQQQREAPSNEPQPDIDLGQGQRTFSKEGLQQWVDWAVGQRLAPIEEARKQEEQRAEAFQAQQQLRTQVQGQMETARAWPQWAEYADDILGKLREDSAAARRAGQRPRMTLREAYLEVRTERLSGDATDARKKVIADLNAAPRSTALRAATEVPRAAGVNSTADIARRNLERLEKGR